MKLNKFEAGFCKVDITPKGRVCLAGQFHVRIPEGTHDRLYCTAAALKSGGDFVIWCSLDLVGVDGGLAAEAAKEIAQSIPEFKREQLIISCIHTHTAPHINSKPRTYDEMLKESTPVGCGAPDEYRYRELIPAIAGACVEAYREVKPSGISPVLGHAVIGHCRRAQYRDGSSVMYGKTDTYNFEQLECAADNGIEMLYIYDLQKNLSGVILNVSCPAQVVEAKSEYSADFVGSFRNILSREYGRDLPVLYLVGAAGDISPRDLVRRGRGEKYPYPKELSASLGSDNYLYTYEYADELGERLYDCFARGLKKSLKNIEYEVEFAHVYEELLLPLRTVTDAEYALAKPELTKIKSKYNGEYSNLSADDKWAATWPAAIVSRYELQQKSTLQSTPVHILRLGNCALATNPFELFSAYGMRIKARSKADFTFIAQLTDASLAYLPTPAAVEAKSYSTLHGSCLISCEGGELLTERQITQINKLMDEE